MQQILRRPSEAAIAQVRCPSRSHAVVLKVLEKQHTQEAKESNNRAQRIVHC